MTTPNYRRILASFPKGLSQIEVATRLGVNTQKARVLILRYRYAYADGRKFGQRPKRKFDPDVADWSKSNVELATEFGVSRERVRSVRKLLGKPFVESRGRKATDECSCGKHNGKTRWCQRRDC